MNNPFYCKRGKINTNFLKNLAELRSRTYWFLSTLYLIRPDARFLRDLRLKLSEVSSKSDKLSELIKLIRESIEGDIQDLSERLAVEFTRLFRGIKKGYSPPPPYESVYRGEGRVMGETTLSVMKFYSEAGFGIIDENEGPQDYIGVELKFISMLCYKEMESWKNGKINEGKRYLELEKRFLKEHILQWIPGFCKIIENEAKEEFYVVVARLTEEFIKIDAGNLEVLLDELKEVKV